MRTLTCVFVLAIVIVVAAVEDSPRRQRSLSFGTDLSSFALGLSYGLGLGGAPSLRAAALPPAGLDNVLLRSLGSGGLVAPSGLFSTIPIAVLNNVPAAAPTTTAPPVVTAAPTTTTMAPPMTPAPATTTTTPAPTPAVTPAPATPTDAAPTLAADVIPPSAPGVDQVIANNGGLFTPNFLPDLTYNNAELNLGWNTGNQYNTLAATYPFTTGFQPIPYPVTKDLPIPRPYPIAQNNPFADAAKVNGPTSTTPAPITKNVRTEFSGVGVQNSELAEASVFSSGLNTGLYSSAVSSVGLSDLGYGSAGLYGVDGGKYTGASLGSYGSTSLYGGDGGKYTGSSLGSYSSASLYDGYGSSGVFKSFSGSIPWSSSYSSKSGELGYRARRLVPAVRVKYTKIGRR